MSPFINLLAAFLALFCFQLVNGVKLRFLASKVTSHQVAEAEPVLVFEDCRPTDKIFSCKNSVTSCEECISDPSKNFLCDSSKKVLLSYFTPSISVGGVDIFYHICWRRVDGSTRLFHVSKQHSIEAMNSYMGRDLQPGGPAGPGGGPVKKTSIPSAVPSFHPSKIPSTSPVSSVPSTNPSVSPIIRAPSSAPSKSPSKSPLSSAPSTNPSVSPSTKTPSNVPSQSPQVKNLK